jgi:hypothetical protein
LLAIGAGILAALEGNTMLEHDVSAKLKHFRAQAAIEAQSPMALSQGLVMGGQQSDMSSIADISVDWTATRAPAPAGSIATDRAIRSARMVRPMLMDQGSRMRIAGSVASWSNDDFAINSRSRRFPMANFDLQLTRRSTLLVVVGCLLPTGAPLAAEPAITVHKDPNCGCCAGWVQHLQRSGFVTTVIETKDIDAVKTRLAVPDDLAACHTAEVSGYVIEGHVPASALKRLLGEKPNATGLAVPGMPVGSPGMEGGQPEPYEVILFGPAGRRTYARFLGGRET